MFCKMFVWMQGRHTFFAFLELVIGSLLAWSGHLDMSFVALVGTIQGMVLGHSIKEDYFAQKGEGATGNEPKKEDSK